jgi:hypothetical protein
MTFQRIGSSGTRSPQTAAPAAPFAPRPFAPARTPEPPVARKEEQPAPQGAPFTIFPPAAAPPARLQRLPSNNNDPTGQMDGTYWDRQTASATRPEGVMGRVTAIMKDADDGGAPSVAPPGWTWLQNKLGKLKGQWVRFHIVNQYLGGPGGSAWNLVPTTVAVNNAFNRDIEEDVKDSANTQQEWTYLDVRLTYNAGWPAPIPTHINAEWGTWDDLNDQWEMQGSLPHALANQDITALGAGFNYMRGVNITQAQMLRRGVPARYVADFTTWLQDYRQNDDDDMEFMDAAESDDDFGAAFDARWLNQVWLDEDDTSPGEYQAVIKAI